MILIFIAGSDHCKPGHTPDQSFRLVLRTSGQKHVQRHLPAPVVSAHGLNATKRAVQLPRRASAAGQQIGLLFAAQAASPLASFTNNIQPQAPALPLHAAQQHTCTAALCQLSGADEIALVCVECSFIGLRFQQEED